MTSAPQPSLPANTGNLIKYLEKSFSTNLTFVTEMMQNSRRAKATYIEFEYNEEGKTLVVTDDGVGITKDSLLFTIAETGWGNCEATADVVDSEDPFGMGFLSVLMSAIHIRIESKDFGIEGNTADILYKNDFHQSKFSSVTTGSRITLTGMKAEFDLKKLTAFIDKKSLGFPITVRLNGGPVSRPHNLKNLSTTRYKEVPGIGYVGFPIPFHWPYSPSYAFYLQGLPVVPSSHGHLGVELTRDVVVHLDSKLWPARVPDRDCLIDGSKVLDLLGEWYAKEVVDYFTGLKERSEPLDFVRYYPELKRHCLLSLLDDVPILPKYVLKVASGIPRMEQSDSDREYLDDYKQHVSKAEIESGSVKVYGINEQYEMGDSRTGAAFLTWLWSQQEEDEAADYVILDDCIGPKHWIREYCHEENSLDSVELEIIGESHTAIYRGYTVSSRTQVVFCDGYTLQPVEDEVEFAKSAVINNLPLWCDRIVYIPSKCGNCDATAVLFQMENFYGDNSDWPDNSLVEREVEKFSTFISMNSGKAPDKVLSELLGDAGLSQFPILENKSFKVTVSGKGFVEVELFDEPTKEAGA